MMTLTKEKGLHQTSAARLAAAQGLYEIEITGVSLDAILTDFNDKRWRAPSIYRNGESQDIEMAEPDRNTFNQIIHGVRKNLIQIDDILSTYLKNDRKIEHLDALLRGVLRAGIFELYFLETVPGRVIINEYVELARAFYSEKEPSLVNGILDSVARAVRKEELEGK